MLPATYRASLSYLLRHPWQLGLALLGISVGVAVIVAVDLANASARKAFLLSMDTITGQATHQVIGGPRGVNEEVYRILRVEHGIDAVAPIVEGTATVASTRMSLLGVDLFAEREFRNLTSDVQTSESNETDATAFFTGFLTTAGAVVVSQATADELGISIGDQFDVLAAGRTHRAELVAVFQGETNAGAGRLLLTDIANAQEWLDSLGLLTRIDVRVASDESSGATQADVEAALPAGNRLLAAAGRTRSTIEMSTAFMTNLTAMSLLALLVGLFLIFNSVSFSVLQRRNLIGVLRALGLTRRQLMSIILIEAGFLGLVAAALGVALGIVLGEHLLALVARTINDLYFRVSVTSVSVDSFVILKGLLAGVVAALVAATLPAFEATAIQPRLAMVRSTLEQGSSRAVPVVTIVGVGLMICATALIALSGTNLVAGLIAVFLAILGLAFCVPWFVRLFVRLASPAAARFGGTAARMAVGGIVAGLSRTGIAIVALTIAVAATIGVSVMVDSFRGSVGNWLEQSLQADVYVGTERGAMSPELVHSIANLDGVEDLSTRRLAWVEDAQRRTQLRVFDLPPVSYAGFELIDGDPAMTWPAWEGTDAVLVSESYAYRFGLGVDDIISLPTDSGTRDFRVTAIFQSFDVGASGVVMSRATYLRHYDDDTIDSLGLYLADSTDADSIVAQIETLAAGGKRILAISNAGLRDESMRVFDRTFVITDILYWLTLSVAFIGMLSAMLALQMERARETATQRALGMTPLQVGSMITTQTSVIGLISGIAAVPLGVIMAWVLIKVINRRAFGWQIDMNVTTDILLVSVALAVAAALLAGLYPAWRAGRSQPAIAMREE